MRRLALLSTIFLFACATVPPPQGTGQADAVGGGLRPMVSIYGPQCAIGTARYERLRTQEQLSEAWGRHLGKARSHREPPLVDFAACEVIAVFAGEGWNSDGIQVVEMLEDAVVRRVRFDHYGYQTEGPGGGGVRVSAFGWFVVPKTELVVVLEQNVQNLIGEPPVWKKRARL